MRPYQSIIKRSEHNTHFIWRKRIRERLQRDDVWDVVSGKLQKPKDLDDENPDDDDRQEEYLMKALFAHDAIFMTMDSESNMWPKNIPFENIAEIWSRLEWRPDSMVCQATAFQQFQNVRYTHDAQALYSSLVDRADQLNEMAGHPEISDKQIIFRLYEELDAGLNLSTDYRHEWSVEDMIRSDVNPLDDDGWLQRLLSAAAEKEQKIKIERIAQQSRNKNARQSPKRRRVE